MFKVPSKGKSKPRMMSGKIHIKPSHKGRLHSALGVEPDTSIPEGKLQEALDSDDPHLRKMANFARNAKSWKH